MTTGHLPADPLFDEQWHLLNRGQPIMGWQQAADAYRNDINVSEVWKDYTGKGVVFGVVDDGVQGRHPDLAANSRIDDFYDLKAGGAGNPSGWHGTSSAGLIWAARNDLGGVGVAFGSKGIGCNGYSDEFSAAVQRMLDDRVDVSSNSWGFATGDVLPFHSQSEQPAFRDSLIRLAKEGRRGLGISVLFAGGNDREYKVDTLFDPSNNSPYVINVAAAHADGTVASYSTRGPNVLVAAPGSGAYSNATTANDITSIVTTDVTGSDGYNKAEDGDYTDARGTGFNGTSAATPIAAGVVGLMLEANPDLGYRDIQEILAYSAAVPATVGVATPVEWETNGATDWNGGGHLHNNDLGFGHVDALAAVRLAETWTKKSTYADLQTVTSSFTDDGSVTVGAGVTRKFEVGFSSASTPLRVQHVTVTVDMTMVGGADDLSKVTLVLKGPGNRTESRLVDPAAYSDGQKAGMPGRLSYTFDTVRNWGEMADAGAWSLSVDNKSASSTLEMSASISLLGDYVTRGQTFVYTDDYSRLASNDASRAELSGAASGSHTLNAAAVTTGTQIDLARKTATIAGKDIRIADGMRFANIFTGDGADALAGSDATDAMTAGRGADTLQGAGGADSLSGGRDDDLVLGQDGADSVLGGEGSDFGSGGFGADTVRGEAGNDLLFGDDDDDLVDGGDGDDLVYGGSGTDAVYGSAGIDQVYGQDGNDFVGAGAGNDFGSGGFGNDEVHGEEGDDLLFGDDGNDGVYGEDGDDLVYGGTGNDVLTGDAGNDLVHGEDGNDGLSGGAGNDTLDGGTGADLLFGNAGDDGLTGGAGADVFAFGAGDGFDRILDFVTGGSEVDVIAFNGAAFADLAGVQAASRQDGADVVIAYGAGDALTLAGVQLGSLSAANFAFA